MVKYPISVFNPHTEANKQAVYANKKFTKIIITYLFFFVAKNLIFKLIIDKSV